MRKIRTSWICRVGVLCNDDSKAKSVANDAIASASEVARAAKSAEICPLSPLRLRGHSASVIPSSQS